MSEQIRRNMVRFLACLLVLTGFGSMITTTAHADTSVQHSFSGPDGANLIGGLVRDTYGNLYGVSYIGGAYNAGSIYMIDADGDQFTLYDFTGGNDGFYPIGTLTIDSSGNLYGVTSGGGTGGKGTLYKLSDSNVLTTLKSFNGASDGGQPSAGVIRDSSGNLYGTTTQGGANGYGTIFKITSAGVYSVLGSFSTSSGTVPQAALVRDSTGNLYGTCAFGGSAGNGTVWKLSTTNVLSVLKSFNGTTDGGQPYFTGVIRDSSGNLYGTARAGGASNNGVIYKISSTGTYSVLYNFTGGVDGGAPYTGVIRDSAGLLYGANTLGGLNNRGVVYRYNPTSGVVSVLANLGGVRGMYPFNNVVRDPSGNIFLSCAYPDGSGSGTVLKITYPYLVNLVSFNGTNGAYPNGGLIKDSSGFYYGTTAQGGPNNYGIIYKFKPGVGLTVLRTLAYADGISPRGTLVRDSSGTLYGTCAYGGAFGYGTIWKLTSSGTFTVLRSFVSTDGAYPSAGLIRDSSGILYGTTQQGGASNYGTIFKITSSGVFTTLFQFNYGNGAYPRGALARDAAGNLYGTTYYGGAVGGGVVFKLNTSNVLTVLKSFYGGSDGAYPASNIALDAAGNLYGTTMSYGASSSGVIFTIDGNGRFFTLHQFNGTDGNIPYSVIRDTSGNIYGSTDGGGAGSNGVIYRLSGSNVMTTLANFGLGDAGVYGIDVLLRDSTSGSLYGVTSNGGGFSKGALFGLLY